MEVSDIYAFTSKGLVPRGKRKMFPTLDLKTEAETLLDDIEANPVRYDQYPNYMGGTPEWWHSATFMVVVAVYPQGKKMVSYREYRVPKLSKAELETEEYKKIYSEATEDDMDFTCSTFDTLSSKECLNSLDWNRWLGIFMNRMITLQEVARVYKKL